MNNSITSIQEKAYRDNFLKHGDTLKGVGWNDRETNELRFERLLKHFDLNNKFSIHDVGSGLGGLHEYLLNRQINHDYQGSEIVAEMIETTKLKFPGIKISNRDILEDDKVEICDIVLLNGAFNLKASIDMNTWKEYVFSIVKKMYECAGWGVSFNFCTSYNTFTDETLAYFDPRELFDFCIKNLSRFVILDHGYPLYESTITVFKEEYLMRKYSAPEFDKYYKIKEL